MTRLQPAGVPYRQAAVPTVEMSQLAQLATTLTILHNSQIIKILLRDWHIHEIMIWPVVCANFAPNLSCDVSWRRCQVGWTGMWTIQNAGIRTDHASRGPLGSLLSSRSYPYSRGGMGRRRTRTRTRKAWLTIQLISLTFQRITFSSGFSTC